MTALRRRLCFTASFSRTALTTEETAVATNMMAIRAAMKVSVAYIIVVILIRGILSKPVGSACARWLFPGEPALAFRRQPFRKLDAH